MLGCSGFLLNDIELTSDVYVYLYDIFTIFYDFCSCMLSSFYSKRPATLKKNLQPGGPTLENFMTWDGVPGCQWQGS